MCLYVEFVWVVYCVVVVVDFLVVLFGYYV